MSTTPRLSACVHGAGNSIQCPVLHRTFSRFLGAYQRASRPQDRHCHSRIAEAAASIAISAHDRTVIRDAFAETLELTPYLDAMFQAWIDERCDVFLRGRTALREECNDCEECAVNVMRAIRENTEPVKCFACADTETP